MRSLQSTIDRHPTVTVAIAMIVLGAASARAQSDNAPPLGRLDFALADLPPANVEFDLSQGMFNDLFGIGDALVAGVAESLLKAADANRGAEGTRMAAEKLAAAREILLLARQVVREVRVRAYHNRPNEPAVPFDQLVARFEGQLKDGNWETVARIRQGNQNARVALLRDKGAIRGVFVIATEGSDVMVANVVAEVSPENVKKLTAAAATVGLENGLQPVIEMQMQKLRGRAPAMRAQPPTTALLSRPAEQTAPAPRTAAPAADAEPKR